MLIIFRAISLESNQTAPKSLAAFYSSTSNPIKIPPRKSREPTDILQALSSTIKKDYTAAHYKYHDDPYLIPLSNASKRTFAMAQEAGRKAAKWIVNEHSDLFQHKVASPPIEAFTPKSVYNKNSNIGEDTLLKVIADGHVTDAIIIFDLLKKKNIELSASAKQAFLEFLCYSNCEELASDEFIEENWFRQSKTKGRRPDVQPKSWKDSGLAEELFSSISPSIESYSAIILGMIKYGQIEKAWYYFNESKEKQYVLHVSVYNALLSIVNSLKQASESRWELTKELLEMMAINKVRPNIGTLNSVLHTLSSSSGPKIREWIFDTIAEFKSLGIEPSLGSWSYVLQALCRDRVRCYVLKDIIDLIEGKSFIIQHPSDVTFFASAMEICHTHLQDLELAKRVDQLLHTGDNYNLIGTSFDESSYYRHYFMLLCSFETIDNLMETYDLLVPNVYTPEPSVFQEIIKAVDLNGSIELLPRIWSDMVSFNLTDRENLLSKLLNCLTSNELPPGSPLIATFGDIAKDIFENIEDQPVGRTNKVNWTGEMLSNILLLHVRNGDIENAGEIMRKLTDSREFLGEAKIEALCAYLDFCISQNNFAKALICMKYCADNGFPETVSMVKDVRKRMTLSDSEVLALEQLGAAALD